MTTTRKLTIKETTWSGPGLGVNGSGRRVIHKGFVVINRAGLPCRWFAKGPNCQNPQAAAQAFADARNEQRNDY